MNSPKAEVLALLERLPDDCSLEDVQYHVFVLACLHKGIKSLGDGKGFPREEVKKRLQEMFLG